MSATVKPLLELSVVTDHDCGNYRIGAVEFSIYPNVEAFLVQYGIEGRNDLVAKLSYLIHFVHAVYEKTPLEKSWSTKCSS